MANDGDLLSFHRELLTDADDTQGRYRRVIEAAVRPGDVVLDLGTGSGIHSILACRAGASRVYAMDSEPVIDLARQVIQANGYDDKVKFLKGFSTDLTLPEKVDVIVSNLGFTPSLAYIPDARRRFLKEGGRLIPSALDMTCVPVEAPQDYDRSVGFWAREQVGVDWAPMHQLALNVSHAARFRSEHFLAGPREVAQVDLTASEKAVIAGRETFVVERPGTLHGLGWWSRLWLDGENAISLEPPLTLPYPLWHHMYFPVQAPVPVRPGDLVEGEVEVRSFIGAGTWLRWSITARGSCGEISSDGSTLEGMPLSIEALKATSPNRAPVLTDRGTAAREVLEWIGEHLSLGDIERQVQEKYGDLFPEKRDAQAFVAGLLEDYAR